MGLLAFILSGVLMFSGGHSSEASLNTVKNNILETKGKGYTIPIIKNSKLAFENKINEINNNKKKIEDVLKKIEEERIRKEEEERLEKQRIEQERLRKLEEEKRRTQTVNKPTNRNTTTNVNHQSNSNAPVATPSYTRALEYRGNVVKIGPVVVANRLSYYDTDSDRIQSVVDRGTTAIEGWDVNFNDNRGTIIYGHNPGVFSRFAGYRSGDSIFVYDNNGNKKEYVYADEILDNPRAHSYSAKTIAMFESITYEENIVLQWCIFPNGVRTLRVIKFVPR